MITRDIQELLLESFRRYDKMLFVSGPRQCGKTTLAKMIMERFPVSRYWDYDIPEDQLLLVERPTFFQEIDRPRGVQPLVVLDEIHKYPHWKNYLKGAFDRFRGEFKFLVTGSGRVDIYRKGGDSLAGRYFQHHLFPFSIGELAGKKLKILDFLSNPDELPEAGEDSWATWQSLEELSGFPEPFVQGEESFYRRWAVPYRKHLLREDIRDLSQVRQLSQMEILSGLLPGKVGGILSINALREDVKVAFETIKSWITIFENFFFIFLVRPWHRRIARAVHKEPKLYLYDWASVPEPAARFENMVALHLFKATTSWTERGEGWFRLHFVRDREKNEVDFLISREEHPILLVETKLGDLEISPALRKMQKALGVPAVQLVNQPGISRKISRHGENVLIVSADRWLRSLP